VRVVPAAGQAGDAPRAHALMQGQAARFVLADAAYDADHIRAAVAAKRATAVIPGNPARARKHPLDRHLHRERHLVGCCFAKLKRFRRIATRHERTARNYLRDHRRGGPLVAVTVHRP
jgi:transposase